MSVSILFQKIRRNLEDHGGRYTIQKSVRHLLSPLYLRRVYRIYRIDLRSKVPQRAVKQNAFCFRLLTPHDTSFIRQIEESHEWLRNALQERLEAGGLCLIACEQDKLAGFNLVAFGEVFVPLVNRYRKFRLGEAWSEQIAVMKEFRKCGLGSELRYRIFDELRSRGIRRFYGGALVTNTPSLKLARAVGFREITDIRYRKLLARESWEFRRVRHEPGSGIRESGCRTDHVSTDELQHESQGCPRPVP